MISADENALICDFAEIYNIYDYKKMPPSQAAILASGLPNDSRIKMKLTDRKFSTAEMLLAAVADRLSILVWAKTKDAQHGRNKPKSILDEMIIKEANYTVFDSIEEFEAARAKILEK